MTGHAVPTMRHQKKGYHTVQGIVSIRLPVQCKVYAQQLFYKSHKHQLELFLGSFFIPFSLIASQEELKTVPSKVQPDQLLLSARIFISLNFLFFPNYCTSCPF